MSAGTLKLTNNSTAVVGTSTLFTTDLKPGDFIVTTIGGVLYTLPVDTVTSNTAVTLVSPFTGPTTTGAAWAAVPRKTMNQVTAELVAQSTEALRGLLAEKGVWTNFYTAPGDITVQLTSSMAPVTGPGWQKMAGLVGSAQQWRGGLPAAANLNAYGPTADFTGTWNRSSNTNTTAAYGFPEDNGQGIVEVYAGGRYGGMQRYTVSANGNVYTRSLTASWNGTDGPWGDWQPVGKKPLNDLGLGLAAVPWTSGTTFDWQLADFIVGQVVNTQYQQWANGPALIGPTPGATTRCYISTELAYGTSAAVKLTVYRGATFAEMYSILITGAKGSRSFAVRQIYTDVELAALGIGIQSMSSVAGFDWQQADLASGAIYYVQTSSWLNVPAGINYPSGTGVFIEVSGTTSGGTVTELTLTPNASADSAYKIFKVRIANAKGSRTFSVRRVLTDIDDTIVAKKVSAIPAAGQTGSGGKISSLWNGGGTDQIAAEMWAEKVIGEARSKLVLSAANLALGVRKWFSFDSDGNTEVEGATQSGTHRATKAPPFSFDALYANTRNIPFNHEQMTVQGLGYFYPFMSQKFYFAGRYGGSFTQGTWCNANPVYCLSYVNEGGGVKSWQFDAVTANATAPAGGSWINGGSSIKIKDKFEPIKSPRETMRKIKAGTWVLKTKDAAGQFGIGVLAEGLYEDYPEAKVTAGNVELADGTLVEDVLSVQAGDSGVLAAVHHAAIISLMDENEAQQNKIESLKSDLEELKKIVEDLIAK